MKKKILFFISLWFVTTVVWSQTTIWSEDFETDGNGSRYTTSVNEFSDGSGDYFIRTDETDIGSAYSLSNLQGSYYFAAQDLDGKGAELPVSITFEDIDISGKSNLEFNVFLAEDDAGSEQDWDNSDYVHIEYDIDNSGTYSNLIWIENDGESFNGRPLIDTDFDGIGDGTEITASFTEFTSIISGTGNTIDIKISFDLNSSDEDIAIDNLSLYEVSNLPEPSNHVTALNATEDSQSQITLTWSDATVIQAPEGYLVKAAIEPATPVAPSDGTAETDGTFVKNITQGTQTAVFSGLSENTTYNFSIYPYTNTGEDIDFKTDGTVPTASGTTAEYEAPSGHTENFDNCSVGASYSDNSFVGAEDITWSYVASRNENGDANSSGIDGNALMLRRSSDNSKIVSSTISSGIGNFSMKLFKGFTGSGNRQVELFINGVSKGISAGFDDYDEHIFAVNDINIAGDVTIEIRNIKSKQVIIDDIYWTNFSFTNTNWTGATDTNWATASNWDNGVPSAIVNAIIPSDGITNFPVISSAAECYSLSISSDATLLGTENLTIYGTANIKRSLREDAWQYLTPPISNATANDFEITTENENAYLVEYDNSVNGSGNDSEIGWNYISSDKVTLSAGKGYGVFVTEAKEVQFSGSLVTENQNINGIVKNSESNNPWILIGNSALANLDWTAVASDADITGSAYVYTKQNGYGTINSDGTVVPSSGTKYIPAMQGFFVEAAATADDETISFPTSALTNEQQDFYKSELVKSNFVRLGVQKGDFTDESVIYFKNDALNSYDPSTDSHKKIELTDEHPQFYTLANEDKLVINTLKHWPIAVPLSIQNNFSEQLKLKAIDVENLDENVVVLLEDKLIGKTYPISKNIEIDIQVEAGENNDRFVLHYANAAATSKVKAKELKAYVFRNKIYFENLSSTAKVNVYNTSGVRVISETINHTQQFLSPNLRRGVYIVKVATKENLVKTFKVNIK